VALSISYAPVVWMGGSIYIESDDSASDSFKSGVDYLPGKMQREGETKNNTRQTSVVSPSVQTMHVHILYKRENGIYLSAAAHLSAVQSSFLHNWPVTEVSE